MKRYIYTTLFLIGGLSLSSCSKDFTETQFYQAKPMAPLESVEELSAFVNGTYAKMRNRDYLGSNYLTYGEIRSDEAYNNMLSDFFSGQTNYTQDASDLFSKSTWEAAYRVVAHANFVIGTPEGKLSWKKSPNTTEISAEIKKLKAQAYAIRGIAFFDLLRLYGQKYTGGSLGIPLPLEYNLNNISTRATLAQTEAQIEGDLNQAISLFQEAASLKGNSLNDLVDTSDKTTLSPLAVKAYQSRFYLYKKNWEKVITLSQEIITANKYNIIPAADLETSFGKPNPSNSIFELAVGVNGSLGTESYEYMLNSGGSLTIVPTAYARSLYEEDDVRKGLITGNDDEGYALNGKFQDLQSRSNIRLVRYEEILLNLTEAYLQQSDQDSALPYYNQLRTQRGLEEASSLDLEELKKERLRELLGEGLRYWDLLRWGDPIPYYDRTGATNPTNNKIAPNRLLAYPIPLSELNSDQSHVTQNEGY